VLVMPVSSWSLRHPACEGAARLKPSYGTPCFTLERRGARPPRCSPARWADQFTSASATQRSAPTCFGSSARPRLAAKRAHRRRPRLAIRHRTARPERNARHPRGLPAQWRLDAPRYETGARGTAFNRRPSRPRAAVARPRASAFAARTARTGPSHWRQSLRPQTPAPDERNATKGVVTCRPNVIGPNRDFRTYYGRRGRCRPALEPVGESMHLIVGRRPVEVAVIVLDVAVK
jgi:hypothetical protein